MKTVHKLILKSYAGPMVLTFFIVLFVFIMQFMWRYIDELVGKGLGVVCGSAKADGGQRVSCSQKNKKFRISA
mgnify:CR=1 FL=1